MGVAHVGLVHRDPCRCKVKGFYAVSSIERNVSKRHLQRAQPQWTDYYKSFYKDFGSKELVILHADASYKLRS